MALTSSLLEVGKSTRGTEIKKSLPESGARGDVIVGFERGLQQEVTAQQVADRAGRVRNLHSRNKRKVFPSRGNSLCQAQKCGEACQV